MLNECCKDLNLRESCGGAKLWLVVGIVASTLKGKVLYSSICAVTRVDSTDLVLFGQDAKVEVQRLSLPKVMSQ